MPTSDVELLRRIERHSNRAAAQAREVVRVGPFEALLDANSDLIWLNYAVPVAPLDAAESVAVGLAELRGVFAERKRTMRFEFNENLWPTLPDALERAGLTFQARHPLMVCMREDLRPVAAPGVTVRMLRAEEPESVFETVSQIMRSAFGDDGGMFAGASLARLRRQLAAREQCVALATLDGVPAGSAGMTVVGETCELGVGTRPECRRRGVAATVCSFLVRDHLDHAGLLAWLSAGDPIAQAVYTKIGFRLVGARLNFIDSLAESSAGSQV